MRALSWATTLYEEHFDSPFDGHSSVGRPVTNSGQTGCAVTLRDTSGLRVYVPVKFQCREVLVRGQLEYEDGDRQYCAVATMNAGGEISIERSFGACSV